MREPSTRRQGPAFNAVPFDPRLVTLNAGRNGNADVRRWRLPATFAYVVNGVPQTKIITRQMFAIPVPVCTFGAGGSGARRPITRTSGGTLPPGSESGWGVNLTHQGDIIFAIWFTYDLDGTPLWLSATLFKGTGPAYAGMLYRSRGPAFSAMPFDPAKVSFTPVGTLSVAFANGNSATFSYTVDGVPGTKQITRQVFRAPGTICQ